MVAVSLESGLYTALTVPPHGISEALEALVALDDSVKLTLSEYNVHCLCPNRFQASSIVSSQISKCVVSCSG